MNAGQIMVLTAQGGLFLLWAIAMFQMLFGIQRRYRDQTGRMWIGPVAVWGVFRNYLRNPSHAWERRRLAVLTILLLTVTLLSVQVMG